MTNPIFKYSLLQYVHSQLLGEQLNLGILFYFPTLNKYEFRSSSRIKKIKSFYKDFPVSTINKYLLEFERGASKETASNEDFSYFIERNFLTHESAPLQFSKAQTAILYTENTALIIDHYLNLYFPDEKEQHLSDTVVKEYSQVDRFRNILLSQNLDPGLLKKAEPIKNDKASFKPDLVWENGSINLVKEIHFNEPSEEKIKDHALLLSNKLNYLSNEIDRKYRIDFLVSKPVKETLLHSYEVALEILQDSKVPKKIVTESQLHDYSIEAANEIRSHIRNKSDH